MKRIYVRTKSQQFGPINMADFRRLVRNGRISLDDCIWDFQRNNWSQIALHENLVSFIKNEIRIHATKIVAIASGKGGVGKTALTASMALELAHLGKKVVVVDADFGGPDLHEWMGISRPPITLSAMFNDRGFNLRDIIVDTQYQNIKIICGDIGNIETTNPRYFQRTKFIRQLRELDAEFVLIDQSPGVSYTTVDIFLSCDEGIIVTLPEPTSFIDAFNFIRSALIRKLKKSLAFSECAITLLQEFETWDWRKYEQPLRSILVKMEREDSRAGMIFKSIIHQFRPKLVTNMIYKKEETDECKAFQEKLNELLMIHSDYLGFIEYQKDFRETIKKVRPFILTNQTTTTEDIPQKKHHLMSTWIKNIMSVINHRQKRAYDRVSDSIIKDHETPHVYMRERSKNFVLNLPTKNSADISYAKV